MASKKIARHVHYRYAGSDRAICKALGGSSDAKATTCPKCLPTAKRALSTLALFSHPIGTRVRFTCGPLGASRPGQLERVTGELYGVDDEGVVFAPHPNRKELANWAYVEVESKETPGQKRYVGVTDRMVKAVDDGYYRNNPEKGLERWPEPTA